MNFKKNKKRNEQDIINEALTAKRLTNEYVMVDDKKVFQEVFLKTTSDDVRLLAEQIKEQICLLLNSNDDICSIEIKNLLDKRTQLLYEPDEFEIKIRKIFEFEKETKKIKNRK